MSALDILLAAQAESPEKLAEALSAEGFSHAEAKKAAVDKFKELNDADGEKTDEILDQLDALKNVVKAVNLHVKEAAAAEQAKADADKARAERAKSIADEVAELEAEDKQQDETPEAAPEVPEVAAEVPEPAAETPQVEETPQPKELVTASSTKKVDFAKLPSSPGPEPVKETKKPEFSIIAAADIPGHSSGSELSGIEGLAAAFSAKISGLERLGGGRTASAPIASIRRNTRPELRSGEPVNGFVDITEALKFATDFSRFGTLDNLVAAGGWCAPSETRYELCPPASTDGLVDIPEVSAPRGGIRYPAGLDFSAIYNGGFHQTEAQAIAGTVKPCISIPCPTFTDVRLDVDGLCIEAPILTATAYPELVQNFVANALAAHVHRINAYKLTRMVALSTANSITLTPDYGAASSALEYIEHHAEWVRYAHRLGVGTPMEAVLPLWARGALRADLAKKNGVELFDVTDARLNAYFNARNIRVQWVYDWQDALTTGTATNFGGATIQDGWPTTMQVLIYPAGTFFAATTDVITLDSVYDSTGLSTNVFTRLFTEEGIAVAKQCYTSYVLTLPVCTSGGSGAQYAPTCANATQLPAAA